MVWRVNYCPTLLIYNYICVLCTLLPLHSWAASRSFLKALHILFSTYIYKIIISRELHQHPLCHDPLQLDLCCPPIYIAGSPQLTASPPCIHPLPCTNQPLPALPLGRPASVGPFQHVPASVVHSPPPITYLHVIYYIWVDFDFFLRRKK